MTAPIESCKKDAKMGKHIRYLWGVVECPWCWEASSASLKRNWLKCCKSPGAKVPDGKCQKRRSQQTTPLTSPQTLQETNFDRLPFYPRNRISPSAQQGGNMLCSRSTAKWIVKIYQGLIFQLEKGLICPKASPIFGPRFGGNMWFPRCTALAYPQAYHLDRFRGKKSMPDCCRHGMEIRALDQAIASELWRNLTDSPRSFAEQLSCDMESACSFHWCHVPLSSLINYYFYGRFEDPWVDASMHYPLAITLLQSTRPVSRLLGGFDKS